MHISVPARHQLAAAGITALVTFALAAPGHAQQGGKKASAHNTYSIREKCIAKAQAAYPDNGLGTTSVMTQRTGVYMDCAKSNGIRP
jgi:hypothetical protein